MKTIKSILATVVILGLSVSAFAMDDDKGSLSVYMTGSDVVSSKAISADLGGTTDIFAPRHENR